MKNLKKALLFVLVLLLTISLQSPSSAQTKAPDVQGLAKDIQIPGTNAVEMPSPLPPDVQGLAKDIQILKMLSIFDFTKVQITQVIPILEEGLEGRAKNLGEIREQLLAGKKYGDLTDTYRKKLEKTNEKIAVKIKELLTEEQKPKAQMVFDMITDEEMTVLMEMLPRMLPLIMARLDVLKGLGIITISEETLNELTGPLASLALEMLGKIQARVKEQVMGILVQPRTIELLKEMEKAKPAAK